MILNRRARFDYHLEDSFEAGIVLFGSEVKSICLGQISLNESFVDIRDGEVFLYNCHINPYKQCRENQEPRRVRKLLLHKKQINKLCGLVERKGYTIVPVKLYKSERGKFKLEICIAKGKNEVDKRHTIKEREWSIKKQRKDFD